MLEGKLGNKAKNKFKIYLNINLEAQPLFVQLEVKEEIGISELKELAIYQFNQYLENSQLQFLLKVTPDCYSFRIAKKSGKPKFDLPCKKLQTEIDPQQNISQIGVSNLVLCHGPDTIVQKVSKPIQKEMGNNSGEPQSTIKYEKKNQSSKQVKPKKQGICCFL